MLVSAEVSADSDDPSFGSSGSEPQAMRATAANMMKAIR
jgi:hypothetical protein